MKKHDNDDETRKLSKTCQLHILCKAHTEQILVIKPLHTKDNSYS